MDWHYFLIDGDWRLLFDEISNEKRKGLYDCHGNNQTADDNLGPVDSADLAAFEWIADDDESLECEHNHQPSF